MALLSQFFTALLLLLHFGLHLSAGSETLSCPAPAGVPGTPGNNGLPGRDGRDGRDGKDGAAGPKGEKGQPGMSVQGPPGKAGPPGIVGPAGSKGVRGDPGPPGVQNTLIKPLQSQISSLTTKVSLLEKVTSFPTSRKVGNKYYVTDGTVAKFDEGVKFCKYAGGTIVVPRNEEQHQALVQLITPFNNKAFIGATDRAVEGQFVDSEGKPLTFSKWGHGQPDNFQGVQDCSDVAVSGVWDDIGCEMPRLIVCEI